MQITDREEAAASTPKELNYNNIKIADIIIMYTLYQIGEPTHGYTLAQLCNMREGALYPILYRLSDRGFIKGTEERVQTPTSRHRIRVNYEPVVPENEFYANTKGIIHGEFFKMKFLQDQLTANGHKIEEMQADSGTILSCNNTGGGCAGSE